MAGEDRQAPADLSPLAGLQADPCGYGYYAAVRLLDCHFRDRPRTGHALRPAEEPVRMGQEASLAFAPSTLSAFAPGAEGQPGRLEVRFFGLLGPNGPLPTHLTEYVRDRQRNAGDLTLGRFLDLFNHRMLALFYRAWASAQPTVSFDRPDADRFGMYFAALFGLGMPGLRGRDAMPDLAKLHFAGHLSCQSRHPAGLRAIAMTFLRLPVEIQEFIGQWLDLPVESRLRLGESADTGGLGTTAIVGTRVWETQHKFRIILGPLSLADYRRMLPGGQSLPRLVAVVRNYLGDQLNWEVNLVLCREEVPAVCVGRTGELGWTTWLLGRPFTEDAADLLLHPLDHVR
jgi:type VI secretion system protein ImpH